jgi:hypothetical protein
MAIAFVANQYSGTVSGSNQIVSGVFTPTAGNTLVAAITINSGSVTVSSVTTNAGTGDTATFVARKVSGTCTVEIWYILSCQSSSSRMTVNLSGSTTASLICQEYSGVVAIGTNANNSALTASSLSVALTTQDTNNFSVVGLGSDGANAWNSSFSAGTFRQRGGTGNANGVMGDGTAASPSSVTCTGSLSLGTGNLAGVAVELRTSSGGGGGFTAKFRKTLSTVGTRVGSRQGY